MHQRPLCIYRSCEKLSVFGSSSATWADRHSQMNLQAPRDMRLNDASFDSGDGKKLNKNCELDINNAVQYTRWLLEFIGVWPMVSGNSSTVKKYLSKLLIVFCVISMAFTLVPTVCHMILREKNPIVKLILLGPVSSCFANMLKYGIIVLSCGTIKLCIEHMKTDWMRVENEDEREIMTKNARVGRGLTVICGVFMYTGGMSYHTILPILKGTTVNELNETVRPLAYPGFDMFFESQKSPTYEIIFFVSCISAFVRYTIIITACNLAAVFVTHTCGQIQIVIWRLENLFDGIDDTRNSDKLRQRISSIIHCHLAGLRLHKQIDEALREICLIEVLAVTMIICLLEYDCMTKWSNGETMATVTYSILLISNVFNIFIFCHIGELLKEQSHQVGNSTYMIEWYRLPGKTGLAIVMIIAMATCPRKISAGRVMELSRSSFAIIIKTSVAYLNMLHTIGV